MKYEEINKVIAEFEEIDIIEFLKRKSGKILDLLALHTDDSFKYRFLTDEVLGLVLSNENAMNNFCRIIRGLRTIPEFIKDNENFRRIVGKNYIKIRFSSIADYDSCLWIYRSFEQYYEYDEIDKSTEENLSTAKADGFSSVLLCFDTSLGNRLLQEDFVKEKYDLSKVLDICNRYSYVPEIFKYKYIDYIIEIGKSDFSEILWHFGNAYSLDKTDLGNDQKFTSLIADSFSEWKYRAIVHLLSGYIDVSLIEEKRKKYYLKRIKNGIGSGEIDGFVFNYVFQDFYINVIKNVREILRYNSEVNLLSENSVEFYKKLIEFNSMSYLEKVEFLKLMMINMKDNDEYYREMLYDDLRYLKNHCYKELMDNSIKLEECFHLYDSVLSKEHGVSVFHLQGEPFNALVREYIATDYFIEDFEKGLLNKDLVAYSFSYIGDEHIGTFYNDNDRKKDKFVLLLHSHINKDNIIYVSKEDAFTTENSIFDVSINVNELHTIDSLLEETENYNELYIKTEYVDEKCDAIVCFDELNDNVVDLAKKCNLPILLIDRGKYISKPKSFKLERNNHYVDVFSD